MNDIMVVIQMIPGRSLRRQLKKALLKVTKEEIKYMKP
jgi:hypothetical protein